MAYRTLLSNAKTFRNDFENKQIGLATYGALTLFHSYYDLSN